MSNDEHIVFDKLAVIVRTTEGKHFQVALTEEMSFALFSELRYFFNGGVVKVLPKEIHGIELVVEDYPQKNSDQ